MDWVLIYMALSGPAYVTSGLPSMEACRAIGDTIATKMYAFRKEDKDTNGKPCYFEHEDGAYFNRPDIWADGKTTSCLTSKVTFGYKCVKTK
jgi:hypothetical protein